jgi:hypothetical protein
MDLPLLEGKEMTIADFLHQNWSDIFMLLCVLVFFYGIKK